MSYALRLYRQRHNWVINFLNRKRLARRWVEIFIGRPLLKVERMSIATWIEQHGLKQSAPASPEQWRRWYTGSNQIEVLRLKAIPLSEYYQTEHWRRVREEALARWGHKCAMDVRHDDTNLSVHHRTYIRLGEELPDDVIPLCQECHEKHHSQRL